MTGLKIKFDYNGCSVDWSASVSGARLIAQTAAVGVVTDLGSDKVVKWRGTELQRRIIGVGAFDLQGVQHILNFASSKTTRDMRSFQNSNPEDQVASVSLKLTGLSGGVISTNINVTNRAGTMVGLNLDV